MASKFEQPEHYVWGELPPDRRFPDERWTRTETRANSKSRKMEGMEKLGVTDRTFGITLETFPNGTKRKRLSLTNNKPN